MAEIIPAATLIVFRDVPMGPPMVLMVERSMAMVFAGGAMVFPGGRIDPADTAFATTLTNAPDDAAARIAAIRETIEEAGLAIGITPLPDAAMIDRLRAGLHAGTPLGGLLAANGLGLALDELVPFARWRPDFGARNYDTHFYLARLPAAAPDAQVDATENVRLVWTKMADALAEADAGAIRVIFPTRRTLERLARHGSFDEAAADARAYPVETITPWAQMIDGVEHLCIPAHLGYPVTFVPIADLQRG